MTVLRVDSNFQPRLQRYYGLESFARQAGRTSRRMPELPEDRQKQVRTAKDLLAKTLKELLLGKDGQPVTGAEPARSCSINPFMRSTTCSTST